MPEIFELSVGGDPSTGIGGRRYSGWKEITVRRAIDAVAGTFEVKVSDRERWPIGPGRTAELLAGGYSIARGFVDRLTVQTGDQGTEWTVAGRDRTAELVDSTAMNSPGEWRGLQVHRIAAEIAEPFGITPILDPGPLSRGTDPGAPIDRFKLNPGETAWRAIERAVRMRGLLAFGTLTGGLLIANRSSEFAGTDRGLRPPVTLEEGVNVVESSATYAYADRFARYVVRGQRPGSDDEFGATVAQVEGEARDAEMEASRPLRVKLIKPDGPITQADAIALAEWEAITRAGRSVKVNVTVPGWRPHFDADPLPREFWQPNRLVHARLPSLRVFQPMLISAVELRATERDGTTSVLTLTRPDAFEPKPVVSAADSPASDLLTEVDDQAAGPLAGLPSSPLGS